MEVNSQHMLGISCMRINMLEWKQTIRNNLARGWASNCCSSWKSCVHESCSLRIPWLHPETEIPQEVPIKRTSLFLIQKIRSPFGGVQNHKQTCKNPIPTLLGWNVSVWTGALGTCGKSKTRLVQRRGVLPPQWGPSKRSPSLQAQGSQRKHRGFHSSWGYLNSWMI